MYQLRRHIISVYKEEMMELSDLCYNQHRIYSDACDQGYFTKVIPGSNHQAEFDRDANAVAALRNYIRENMDEGVITKSPDFVQGGKRGWWKFFINRVEGIDDGRKYGFSATITLQNDFQFSYITLTLGEPK
jgi:hypothetical protein